MTQSLISTLWLDVCTSVKQKQSDTVHVCGFFPLFWSGWWVRVCLSATAKWCMVNVAETQPGHSEGRHKGVDDAVREDRRGLLLDIFLKAPSSSTPMSFSHTHIHNTHPHPKHTLCGSFFSYQMQGYKGTTVLWKRRWIFTLSVLVQRTSDTSMNYCKKCFGYMLVPSGK